MKADVLNLVNLLSGGTADTNVTPGIYDDIVKGWASSNILTNAYLQPVAAPGQPTHDLAPNLLTIQTFIWDNREVRELSLRDVESLDPGWRNRTGTPHSYVIETESARTLRLYPAPKLPSDPNLGNYGEPLGRDYPAYSTVMIGAETRVDVPVQYELPLALLILQREMSRESDHMDMEFATLAGQMGGTLLSMARGMSP